ncbi:MAG: tripartite tricarboxylate transporter substrate binding protein [Betaproteobacteria bacterium]|nr:MAG: tripartite tricarboxylate transporter substrate binding protein [Betaproteobacteria bacterium]
MRFLLIRMAICAGALVAVALDAGAQATLPKMIKIVVPFSPGASNDVIARAIAAPLSKRLDIPVIVENKAGAAGVIGADAVAKSPHDGSVLLMTSSTFLTAAATQPQLPYDAVASFAPVAMIGQGPLLLAVSASTPFKSPADLLSAARVKPGSLTYGSAGVGSVGHLATELLNDAAKVQMTHVPYKGAANAVVDLAAGRIDVMVSSYSTLAPLMKTGKVRALAVTSTKAHAAFADLPPLAASVPGFSIDIWVGVFAPAGTSVSLIERLNREINDISASTELATILEPDGTVAVAMTPSALASRVKEELAQWKQIATDHKIVAE